MTRIRREDDEKTTRIRREDDENTTRRRREDDGIVVIITGNVYMMRCDAMIIDANR